MWKHRWFRRLLRTVGVCTDLCYVYVLLNKPGPGHSSPKFVLEILLWVAISSRRMSVVAFCEWTREGDDWMNYMHNLLTEGQITFVECLVLLSADFVFLYVFNIVDIFTDLFFISKRFKIWYKISLCSPGWSWTHRTLPPEFRDYKCVLPLPSTNQSIL